MDARDRYAQMTGDYQNAYRLLEGDEEGYYYTDKMMERAVGLLDSATDTGEQTYFQTLLEKRGPHTGSFLGGTYACLLSMVEKTLQTSESKTIWANWKNSIMACSL